MTLPSSPRTQFPLYRDTKALGRTHYHLVKDLDALPVDSPLQSEIDIVLKALLKVYRELQSPHGGKVSKLLLAAHCILLHPFPSTIDYAIIEAIWVSNIKALGSLTSSLPQRRQALFVFDILYPLLKSGEKESIHLLLSNSIHADLHSDSPPHQQFALTLLSRAPQAAHTFPQILSKSRALQTHPTEFLALTALYLSASPSDLLRIISQPQKHTLSYLSKSVGLATKTRFGKLEKRKFWEFVVVLPSLLLEKTTTKKGTDGLLRRILEFLKIHSQTEEETSMSAEAAKTIVRWAEKKKRWSLVASAIPLLPTTDVVVFLDNSPLTVVALRCLTTSLTSSITSKVLSCLDDESHNVRIAALRLLNRHDATILHKMEESNGLPLDRALEVAEVAGESEGVKFIGSLKKLVVGEKVEELIVAYFSDMFDRKPNTYRHEMLLGIVQNLKENWNPTWTLLLCSMIGRVEIDATESSKIESSLVDALSKSDDSLKEIIILSSTRLVCKHQPERWLVDAIASYETNETPSTAKLARRFGLLLSSFTRDEKNQILRDSQSQPLPSFSKILKVCIPLELSPTSSLAASPPPFTSRPLSSASSHPSIPSPRPFGGWKRETDIPLSTLGYKDSDDTSDISEVSSNIDAYLPSTGTWMKDPGLEKSLGNLKLA